VIPVERLAARVLVLDPDGALLLFRGRDPSRPEQDAFWFTPGGGVEGDETLLVTARREVLEETGLEVTELGGPIFERTTEFDFEDERIRQTEHFFFVRAGRFEPDDSRWTDLERRFMLEHRWWTAAEIAATAETIHPENLAALLSQLA
jgi:8-oxo-dGTP pyrophosphatase MutT (NUDIX family)